MSSLLTGGYGMTSPEAGYCTIHLEKDVEKILQIVEETAQSTLGRSWGSNII